MTMAPKHRQINTQPSKTHGGSEAMYAIDAAALETRV